MKIKPILYLFLVSAHIVLSAAADTPYKLLGLYGTFPKNLHRAIEEIKQQKAVKSPPNYMPIRDPKAKRFYNRLLFFGEAGVGKSMAAETAATTAGAHKLVKSAPSLVTRYINSGAACIKKLKEEALDLYEKDKKHVVIILNEVDSIIRNDKVDPDSDTYRTYHNASIELWSLLSDFENDPRISIFMTTNTLDDADPQFLRRIKGREVHFKKPNAVDRQTFFEGTTRKFNIDFFDLFIHSLSRSPILHKALHEEKLSNALKFTVKRNWWWFFKKYIPNKPQQEDIRNHWLSANYIEYKNYVQKQLSSSKINKYQQKFVDRRGNKSHPQFEQNCEIIKQKVLNSLEEQLNQAVASSSIKTNDLKTLFNIAALNQLAAVTKNFSYRDLDEVIKSLQRKEVEDYPEISAIIHEVHKDVSQETEKKVEEEKKEKEDEIIKANDDEIQRLEKNLKSSQNWQFLLRAINKIMTPQQRRY
ncbi:MAG TPA: AAA family ATPase [Candidatus Babeliales bacterium]|nr:AAA family ATPase [Candidatus Babeliales bacterium]